MREKMGEESERKWWRRFTDGGKKKEGLGCFFQKMMNSSGGKMVG